MQRELKFKSYWKDATSGEVTTDSMTIRFNKSAYMADSQHSSRRDLIGFCQYTDLNDKNGVEIYEGDIVQIRTPFRITQTHEGDNIPNGSYTEPLEPGIQIYVGEIIFLDGMFQITSHPDFSNTPSPIIWEMMTWDEEAIKNGIDTRGMIWDDPEEGDLQYLLGLAGVTTLEELTHYFGVQVIGNKFQHPHRAE